MHRGMESGGYVQQEGVTTGQREACMVRVEKREAGGLIVSGWEGRGGDARVGKERKKGKRRERMESSEREGGGER